MDRFNGYFTLGIVKDAKMSGLDCPLTIISVGKASNS